MKTIGIIAVLLLVPFETASGTMLRIWRDSSGSILEEEFGPAVQRLITVLQKLGTRVEGVEVVRFSRAGIRIWSEPIEQFKWGAEQTPVFTLSAKIYKIARAEEQQHANQKLSRTVEAELSKLCSFLSEAPAQKAQCTRFADLAVRLYDEDNLFNLILTDGWDDCARRAMAATKRSGTGKLLIVLLPCTRDRDGVSDENATFLQRSRDMSRFFPTATIVRPYLLEKALEQMITNK